MKKIKHGDVWTFIGDELNTHLIIVTDIKKNYVIGNLISADDISSSLRIDLMISKECLHEFVRRRICNALDIDITCLALCKYVNEFITGNKQDELEISSLRGGYVDFILDKDPCLENFDTVKKRIIEDAAILQHGNF